MPFVPVMPLTARIWTNPFTPVSGPPRVTVACQLYVAKPYSLSSQRGNLDAEVEWCRFLFVPAGTDIRGVNRTYLGDALDLEERPGWFYVVKDVDDRWLGTDHSYRMAVLARNTDWSWPLP